VPEEPLLKVAKAVLLLDGKFVLQLRDDKPDIAAAGLWGTFGGAIEEGETPEEAIVREVEEELCIRPEFTFLWRADYHSDFIGGMVASWVFRASVDELWAGHRVNEGQGAGTFAYDDLPRDRVSAPALEVLDRFQATIGR